MISAALVVAVNSASASLLDDSLLPALKGGGINLSHWWAQAPGGDYSDQRLKTWMTEKDAELVRKMGFKHVRFTLEPKAIWNESSPGSLPKERLDMLKKSVSWYTSRGMVVILDCHPSGDFKQNLASNATNITKFEAWWKSLAKSFSTISNKQLIFEILNEPEFKSASQWRAVQGRLLKAVRSSAPGHAVVVTGHEWGGIQNLLDLAPYDDKNLIYSFHCYDPHLFTHQGASWGWEATQHVKNLPWPTSPEAYAPLLSGIEREDVRGFVKNLGEEKWGPARVLVNLKRAADWGAKHKVPVYCGEFGSYRSFTQPKDRLAWISDTRSALNKLKVGWAMWDYAGGFAVAVGEPGDRKPDPDTVKALGY